MRGRLSTLARGAASPLGPGGSWSLVFQDEFNGSTLDTSKWCPNWPVYTQGFSDPLFPARITSPAAPSLVQAAYAPAQITVSGGVATFSAAAGSTTTYDSVVYPYKTGYMTTFGHTRWQFGFFEARIYGPGLAGNTTNWPQFWLDGTDNAPTILEIDIMEGLGSGGVARPTATFHNWYGSQSPATTQLQSSLSEPAWHTYGVNWQAASITFYYDGVLFLTVTPTATKPYGANGFGQAYFGANTLRAFREPMYINLGLDVPNTSGAVYSGPTTAPDSMLVDYVRVWS